MAQNGLGGIAIASELKERKIVAPSVYKYQHGDTRFSRYPAIVNDDIYAWCPATIRQILCDPVYTGQLISLKTECVDCKTKRTIYVPQDKHILTMGDRGRFCALACQDIEPFPVFLFRLAPISTKS